MADSRKVYRARFVIPIDQRPISNGYVTVERKKIVDVGQWSTKDHASTPADNVVDWGEVAIIPALVNPHTHLEFSNLRHPLGQPGIEFTDWIRQVVAARSLQSPTETAASKPKSILRGLAESYRNGVGCIGEIATHPTSVADYRCRSGRSGIETVIFYEQLGRSPNLFAQRQNELMEFLSCLEPTRSKADQAGFNARPAISPHAPYSVHPDLLKQMIDVAVATRVPVAMHLAETEAERELLANQTGSFVELLKDFGIWDPASFLPRQSIGEILENLSRCARVLVVHGNYLRDDEIQSIAKHRERMTVIFCPRTHDYFQHSPYPLEQLQRAGVSVALGTDSRASNPDLNLFAELQTVAQKFPNQSPAAILEMGTLNGAKGLGMATQFGSLSPGKSARLSVLEHPDAGFANLDWLLDTQTKCRSLI